MINADYLKERFRSEEEYGLFILELELFNLDYPYVEFSTDGSCLIISNLTGIASHDMFPIFNKYHIELYVLFGSDSSCTAKTI